MSALALKLDDVHEPSVEEIEAARQAARELHKFGGRRAPVRFTAEGIEDSAPIILPANVFSSVLKLLVEMGNGNAVAIVPVEAELTTQQAADLLNVSRPHLIKLVERGELTFRMVGTHRKLKAQEVLTYRDKTDMVRREALAKMAEADQALGLYEDEPLAGSDQRC